MGGGANSSFEDFISDNYTIVTISSASNTNNLSLQQGDVVIFGYGDGGTNCSINYSGDFVEVVKQITSNNKHAVAIYELQGTTGTVTGTGYSNSWALLQLRRNS